MKRAFLLFFACLCFCSVHAAYLRNIPMTLTQPDGTILQCFASGDEYFNYLHDGNGYTIMQHPQTGYYVYAEKREDKLVATNYIAGVTDPASKALEPYALISPEEWMAKRKAWEVPDEDHVNRANPNHGTLNNISIFIRFSDDGEFTNTFSSIDNMFNDVSTNAVSMRSYFRAASYGAIEIPTTFYPGHNGETIISYQDTYPRNYFQPYNASSNTNGYQDDDQRREREFSLLERAVTYINRHYPIPSNLNIDYDNDGKVDNVCFIVRGNVGAWSSLLWPHKWSLYDRTVKINGKRVYTFNFQLADATTYFNASTMCHEMNHSLGAPDLYHYYHGTNLSPVGGWDLMENNAMPPQHCGAYMKMKYGHWIDNIPEITQSGTYTLNPISSSSPTNVAYKIRTNVSNQFYVLEYRDNTSLFESDLPGSGLLIYRINTSFDGNNEYDPDNGIYDEIYLFRPGGSVTTNGNIGNAYFSANVGRTEFNANTDPHPFFTDGTTDNNLVIYNITSAGSTISFTYGISGIGAPTNLVATALDEHTVSLTWNAVSGASSYNVYRNGEYVGNTSATTYIDSNLDYGQYTYYLTSLDANQAMSYPSETVTVSIQPENAVIIGDGSTTTSDALPSYTYFNYSLSEQIYTSAELGDAGNITSIAFLNTGATKTRTFEFYLKNTTKSTFDDYADWITVAESDKVYSGSVTMTANEWTTITFDTPFFYDGSSNVVLVADDNTGNYTSAPHMSCRVMEAPYQAIRVYTDNNDYSPMTPPTDYGVYDNASLLTEKNQLLIVKEIPTFNITVAANPTNAGTVSGSGEFAMGTSCTVTATANEGYVFTGWTENGEVVSANAAYTFTVLQDRDLVATFAEGIQIGSGTTSSIYLPSLSNNNYSLTQQIYKANEIGTAGTITSIAFFNTGTEMTRTYDLYLVHTNKNVFTENNDTFDWIPVTNADKVFSGSVHFVVGGWTVITFDTPFEYNGTNNLALITHDKTGSSNVGLSCRSFGDSYGVSIYIWSGSGIDPMHPEGLSGLDTNQKNQILLGFSTSQTFTKVITGYTANTRDRYYLIASPIGDVDPNEVENMLSNDYDLYYFDQNPAIDPETGVGLEWINYETSTGVNEDFGNLVSGKGYLYANSNTVTLSFVGTPYDGDGMVTLRKNGGTMEGWNLVGNPFGQTAYLNRDFYVMNDAGTEITAAERNSVEAMEGVFVVANNDNETLTFSTTEPTKNAMLALNLSQGQGVIDRAIIRFGQSGMLPKIQMNRNSTKVYVPMDDADYAVVPASEIGEMPINFKAEKNGMYSFSISNNDVDFGYLHLVDNLTGADVDLLTPNNEAVIAGEDPQSPALVYTFTAKTTDYESRFKLVFNAKEDSPSTGSGAFAYYADGEIRFVEPLQDATLQIVDVMGRVVFSVGDVSGNVSTSGMTPGVYMLRLIEGNDVRVQKIVVN